MNEAQEEQILSQLTFVSKQKQYQLSLFLINNNKNLWPWKWAKTWGHKKQYEHINLVKVTILQFQKVVVHFSLIQ